MRIIKHRWMPFAGAVLGAAGLLFIFQMAAGSGTSEEQMTSADTGDDFHEGTISVTETGEVSAEPDTAYIHLGAEAADESADEAQNEVNERINAIREVLESYGIEDDNVQTIRLNVYPDQQQEQDPENEGAGEEQHRAEHILEIEFAEIDHLGELIDDVSESGANRIEQTRFDLEDSEEAEHEALQQAIGQTGAKADAMAESAGMERGEVLQISDQQMQVDFPGQQFDADDAAAGQEDSAAEVETGEVQITQHVTVVYELQ